MVHIKRIQRKKTPNSSFHLLNVKYIQVILYTLFKLASKHEICVVTPFHWHEDWNLNRWSNFLLLRGQKILILPISSAAPKLLLFLIGNTYIVLPMFCILVLVMEILPPSPFHRWYTETQRNLVTDLRSLGERESQDPCSGLMKPTVWIRVWQWLWTTILHRAFWGSWKGENRVWQTQVSGCTSWSLA